MLSFFRLRAVDGVETVDNRVYERSIAIDAEAALLAVHDDPERAELVATVSASNVPTAVVAARLRRAFDLDEQAAAAARHLALDPDLAPIVAALPVIRIPGHWEPFETAIRAVLGQQVTLAAARRLASRLVERAGPVIGDAKDGRTHRLFPSPRQVVDADLSAMGMPGARVRTLQAVAEAALADPLLFRRGTILEETVARLAAIKGVGSWTAQYIALRACREPDAFPASDVGLLRGMARDGRRPTPAELLEKAEAWRPYRAYAAHYIWAGDAGRGGAEKTE